MVRVGSTSSHAASGADILASLGFDDQHIYGVDNLASSACETRSFSGAFSCMYRSFSRGVLNRYALSLPHTILIRLVPTRFLYST